MKNVLYISNIEVPYRTEFFNKLSNQCNLTVLYERKTSSNRNKQWEKSVHADYKIKYLSGIKLIKEYSFDFKIIKEVLSKEYDEIIIGCYNSPIQLLAILILKLFRKKYILNLDGEFFIKGNSIKDRIKMFFIKGAKKYLIAGEKSAISLKKIIKNKKIYVYYFSSLTQDEINDNAKNKNHNKNNTVLVIGQFFDYKGLDIAAQAAKLNVEINYKFIGMGNKSNDFINYLKQINSNNNVEVIPFLQKSELKEEYKSCKALVLPSRQECWGLVINEAASFGVPIISTYGSGAAIEFLSDRYNVFLAKQNDANDLFNKINKLLEYEKISEYQQYLLEKSQNYSIENMVKAHISAINE